MQVVARPEALRLAADLASLPEAGGEGNLDLFLWTTLSRRDGTFIDEELRESQTDLLYQVRHVETGQPMSVYVLLEHQSSPDPWMRLRLLRYCCRIWEDDLRDDPGRRGLRPIVPVVFYQGTCGWTHSAEFADLFPEAARAWPWVPRFAHVLLDQTGLAPEAVVGDVKARIVQLLLMAASGRRRPCDWRPSWPRRRKRAARAPWNCSSRT